MVDCCTAGTAYFGVQNHQQDHRHCTSRQPSYVPSRWRRAACYLVSDHETATSSNNWISGTAFCDIVNYKKLQLRPLCHSHSIKKWQSACAGSFFMACLTGASNAKENAPTIRTKHERGRARDKNQKSWFVASSLILIAPIKFYHPTGCNLTSLYHYYMD